MAGFWTNPITGEYERVSYLNHRACNTCKIAFPRFGPHKHAGARSCPCCQNKLRERSRCNRQIQNPKIDAGRM